MRLNSSTLDRSEDLKAETNQDIYIYIYIGLVVILSHVFLFLLIQFVWLHFVHFSCDNHKYNLIDCILSAD